MKKILSFVLAVALTLSFAGLAFADETANVSAISAVISGDAPTKVGDIVKVDFVIDSITNSRFTVGKVLFSFNDALVQCTKDGYVSEDEDPDEETTLPDDFYKIPKKWSAVYVDGKTNQGGASVYSTTYSDGVDVPEGGYVVFSAYFKVVKDNATAKVAFVSLEEDEYGTKIENGSLTTYTATNLTFDIGEVAPSAKKITAVDAVDLGEVEIGAEVTLPATVKATVEGETDKIDVAVTWEAVDTTVAGDKTVNGTVTAPEGYELAEGVKATATFTVKEAAPVAKKITAVDAVDLGEVENGAEVTLPATVKATVEGETDKIDVAVTWEAVDTTVAGDKTVNGTVTAPEGYELAEGVKATATLTVKEAAPAVKVIASIVIPEVSAVVGGDAALGDKLTAKVVGGDDIELDVVWEAVDTTTAGEKTVKGTITVPEGYELAEGLTTEVEIKINVVEPSAGEKNLPVYITAAFTPNGFNGATIVVNAVKNGAYTGSLTLKNTIAIVVTFKNGKTPLGVAGQTFTVTDIADLTNLKATFASTVIPEGTDNVDVSVVQDLDLEQAISETNLGTPVANGYNFVVE